MGERGLGMGERFEGGFELTNKHVPKHRYPAMV